VLHLHCLMTATADWLTVVCICWLDLLGILYIAFAYNYAAKGGQEDGECKNYIFLWTFFPDGP